MKIKLLQILSFTLFLVALAIALGVYYVISFIPFKIDPSNQVCETNCEPQVGLIPNLVTLSLGALTFSVMTFLHSRALKKQEERDRMP